MAGVPQTPGDMFLVSMPHKYGTDALEWRHPAIQDMRKLIHQILKQYNGKKDDHNARFAFLIRELQLEYWFKISPLFQRRADRDELDRYCSLEEFPQKGKKVIRNNGRVLVTTPIGVIYNKDFC